MELETVNGFVVIARAFDRNGQSLILAARRHSILDFEYVTAWHSAGAKEWVAGHYHSGYSGLDRAIEDFKARVTE